MSELASIGVYVLAAFLSLWAVGIYFQALVKLQVTRDYILLSFISIIFMTIALMLVGWAA